MMSAIVFTPESWRGADLAREREVLARSMVWLVSAVVAGVVRDVTLAVPEGLGFSELADQSGCTLVQADTERDRLRRAMAACKEPRVLVLVAGYQPDAGLVEEIDILAQRAPTDITAVLLRVPSSLLQRLLPDRAPVVGALISCGEEIDGGFDRLARRARRRGARLHARAHPIR